MKEATLEEITKLGIPRKCGRRTILNKLEIGYLDNLDVLYMPKERVAEILTIEYLSTCSLQAI